MKTIRNTAIIFTAFMLAALGVFLAIYTRASLIVVNPDSYTDQELEYYKKIIDVVKNSFDQGRTQLFIAVLVFWGIILLSGYVLIWLIWHFQVKPVQEMEQYASEIAKGNLDVSLPIRKNNLFGNFTESFDMMREELKRSKDSEMEAQKAKRDMVAELSHDLKTPVATIGATCEVLDMKYRMKLKNGDPDEVKDAEDMIEKIGYIKDKSDVINELVDNVLRASEDELDEISVNPKEVESTVIEEFFVSSRDYVNVVFDNHIQECLLYIDKLRMKQVIDNVIGNSIKYAGTDIHVSFSETEGVPNNDGSKNSFIKVKIRDFGPGVSEEDIPIIVEKFARGKNAEDKSGYGLGLFLVKFYMEKQGGGMNYYNDNGFVVELLVRKV